jgi:hypothetical protein
MHDTANPLGRLAKPRLSSAPANGWWFLLAPLARKRKVRGALRESPTTGRTRQIRWVVQALARCRLGRAQAANR